MVFSAQAGTEENLPDFLCEAKEHLTNSEEALLALDQDRENKELINTVFRAFHTIKGVSGFMALKPIVALAHSAEQLLDGARSGTVLLHRPELDLILASCDMMARLLGVLEGASGPARGDFEMLVQRLDAAARGAAGAPEAPKAERVAPVAAVPEAGDAGVGAGTALASTAAASSGAAPEAEARPAGEAESAGATKLRKSDQTVKVNTSRMDSLVTMVGELVIAQQMVVQDMTRLMGPGGGNPRVQRTLGHMSKMIRDLQEVSMSLRMVNLKSTFQRMTRLVRDVSQKAGKQIEVFTEGEDVELDRNVVEAITDPLVHMIRNSCDHGVEGADERRAAGKPPVGRVSLRAYHAGGSIVIEIGDDGRGLRREKLLAKARSKGLIAADVNDASMPDSEVFSLIFLPGFSTAEKVTDISGRGVGMDVVRRNIEALRGKIEIRSTPGEGTTFLLRLPLTMAIIDGMVVRVGSQRYVLPTLSIQQSFRPKGSDLKTAVGVGEMVRVRGTMLPIYRLNRVLGLGEGKDILEDALLIVMEADDLRFCLMVDEILGQQQVVIKTLTQTGQQLRGVSGGAILGDGRVALILDVAQVAGLAREGPSGAGEPREQGVPVEAA
ncbi:MAG: chemotaxis protein CheA [Leptolyngbya sp. PLA1]|nr:chemotaxis protein CheA [Leptolyngbya sp. PLA1]